MLQSRATLASRVKRCRVLLRLATAWLSLTTFSIGAVLQNATTITTIYDSGMLNAMLLQHNVIIWAGGSSVLLQTDA